MAFFGLPDSMAALAKSVSASFLNLTLTFIHLPLYFVVHVLHFNTKLFRLSRSINANLCWQRSAAAFILAQFGFKVVVLEGGARSGNQYCSLDDNRGLDNKKTPNYVGVLLY